jgi:hypothetical protein
VLLPVTITPPASLQPGETFTLQVYAEWLMCDEVCMPGDATLTLKLPVAAETPKPDATFGSRIAAVLAALPRADAAWDVSASRAGKVITLTVTPAQAGAHVPEGLHFFADDNLVAYELPQTVTADGKGGYVLTLALSPDGPQDAEKLLGVLTAANGWKADGSLPALRIDTPFRSGAKPAAVAGTVSSAPSTPAGSGTPPVATGLIGTLALAFLGGLILNLMPCVFPVLGIKILGFVNQAGSDKKKVITHGLIFTLGRAALVLDPRRRARRAPGRRRPARLGLPAPVARLRLRPRRADARVRAQHERRV